MSKSDIKGLAVSNNGSVPLRSGTLSSLEASRYIGVSKKTLLKYCRDRYITYMRYPGGEFRFRQAALDLFMSRCTIQGKKAA